jgi:hypothetical protein
MTERRVNGPTGKQNRIIHILEQQLIREELLDEKGYRLLLMELFGKRSSKDLTREEASFLIDRLVNMGGEISWVPNHGSRRGRIPAMRFHEESSVEGLRNEVLQIARERYGENFEKPLAALCKKLHIEDFRSMDVRHGKALKKTLLRLQAERRHMPEKE